jgi:hypothetical protein
MDYVTAACNDDPNPSVDWSGSWGIEVSGGTCAPTPPWLPQDEILKVQEVLKGNLGGCGVVCDTSACNCMDGTLVITQLNDSAMLISVPMNIVGQGSFTPTSGVFWKTGNAGQTATGEFDAFNITWDVTRIGNAITFMNRPSYDCQQTLMMSSSSTNWTELALIIAGVAVAAILIAVWCLWKPLKRRFGKGDQMGLNADPQAAAYPSAVVSAPYAVLPSSPRRGN